ncbi:terminase [Pigmentiphaga litoralis]|uniref:phage terminase large subunit family protein n=1 Tax=Pigmentiphaga litoralis TaxID=516702 RepID=UPI0019B6688F|nr:terminase gpA endonuclease subunit [Pigmentiphaga litoralis]GGX33180.1 terminase [Pigmentiphaga litoralis]
MDLSETSHFSEEALVHHLGRGVKSFGVPEPLRLDEWAETHFYLSAESSYVEQRWRAWPLQRAILACIGNDDIRSVDVKKSARVGYTKILLAAIGYFAEHKRRNQGLWQPTDDDRDEFVKTELDTMLRGVPVMREVFPQYLARHKDNTLQQKKFLGSILHLRGGKAAKNYRRLSIDFAALDELSGFDGNVEKEGAPDMLAAKRVEGATFPKMVCGSTPKLKGFCLIDARVQQADVRYVYQVRCQGCGDAHPLTWGGKDLTHGMKWWDNDPDTVRHLCKCGYLSTQAEYLASWEDGFYLGDDGSTLDHQGNFRDANGDPMEPPKHIAFHRLWTAYSPSVSWSDIVREFLEAWQKHQEGDSAKLQTFTNTTLGETWEGEIERTEADELKQRAVPLRLGTVPRGCLLLLASGDTQDNRVEVDVWGFGRGSQMWTIDHQVFYGSPSDDEVRDKVKAYLTETTFPHECGTLLKIEGSAIDSGGHHTQAVYDLARTNKHHRIFAIRGRPSGEKHIKDGAAPVDINWRGKKVKGGTILWHVGTNLAKDLLFTRLGVQKPGPGYINFSNELSDEWFKQFTGEVRATRRTLSGTQTRWTATRKRVEALDMAAYAVWLEHHFELNRKSSAWWDALEEKVQPRINDLWAPPAPIAAAGTSDQATIATPSEAVDRGAAHVPTEREAAVAEAAAPPAVVAKALGPGRLSLGGWKRGGR